MIYHKPVLLQSALQYLNVRPGHLYIDATFGGGGHSAAIISNGGRVLTLDVDPDTGAEVHANFSHLSEIAHTHNWFPVAGIIFDLGVSSHQIDTPSRGFSFQSNGPLDMRMDPSLSVTAADLVNHLTQKPLSRIFSDFAQIPNSSSLAQKVISARPITSTSQLAKITTQRSRQAFQALRIAVNAELDALSAALPQALDILEPNGRLVVISFHSLEDRIVKQSFRTWQSRGLGEILTPKPIRCDSSEIRLNSRAKSAKLRSFSKK